MMVRIEGLIGGDEKKKREYKTNWFLGYETKKEGLEMLISWLNYLFWVVNNCKLFGILNRKKIWTYLYSAC